MIVLVSTISYLTFKVHRALKDLQEVSQQTQNNTKVIVDSINFLNAQVQLGACIQEKSFTQKLPLEELKKLCQ